MNSSDLRFATPLFVLFVTACSDGGPASSDGDTSGDETEAQAAEVRSKNCNGAVGTDRSHYAAAEPNVARELAASLKSSFVVNGRSFVPGVLAASSSPSRFANAATLELATWSTMSTTAFDGDQTADGNLVVRLQGHPTKDAGGKAAKALFEAMTNAPQTSENGFDVRRSSKGSVVCARSTTHVQCALGPLGHVDQTTACPKK